MTYELIIVGGGPAGAAAGVYAARKKINTLLVTYDFGGQSIVSAEIQNWIGTKSIAGEELARQLKEHVTSYQGPDFKIQEGVKVNTISRDENGFKVLLDSGQTLTTKTVLIATGAERRRLTVPGTKEFEQRGITYCATCDGPLFGGKNVAVIGGGNAGFETAAQLLSYCPSVTLLHHNQTPKADAITMEKIKQHPNFHLILNAQTQEFRGDRFVKQLIYKNALTGEIKDLAVEGVFVEIGLVPTTYFVKDLVTLNPYGMIVVDPRNQRASVAGVWAAGDCTDGFFHQNNIAAGDAVKALEDIYNYLRLSA